MSREASQELKTLIPEIPFLGGDGSAFTPMIIQTAEMVTLYRVLKRRDWEAREIGRLLYDIAEAYYGRSTSLLRR
jgi:hypothetical protein